jgi:hypothetical protein
MINSTLAYNSIIGLINQLGLKHDVHKFSSGAIMVDIWHNGGFYVVQIEEELIGFSIINDDTGFDNNPDEKFYDIQKAIERLRSILINPV